MREWWILFKDVLSHRSSFNFFVDKAPTFTASPAINVVTEGDSFVTLTVEVAGEYDVSVTWYKDGTLVNGSKYHTESRKLGSTAGFDRSVQSNLTIASPRRSLSDDVFLAQAAYGSHSPISMSNILLIVWCMYLPYFEHFNDNANLPHQYRIAFSVEMILLSLRVLLYLIITSFSLSTVIASQQFQGK